LGYYDGGFQEEEEKRGLLTWLFIYYYSFSFSPCELFGEMVIGWRASLLLILVSFLSLSD
jgi:hypothetical protein